MITILNNSKFGLFQMNLSYQIGRTYFELSNHASTPLSTGLGNVLTVVTDRKFAVDDGGGGISFYTPDVVSASDYYPFVQQNNELCISTSEVDFANPAISGRMAMSERSFSSDNYRYGFQGQEKDNEIKGSGNSLNYKYRMHDTRLGRFFAVDPLASKYPWNSSYAFSSNIVIHAIELEGLEAVVGVSLGGDMWYAPKKLESIHAGAIAENIVKPTQPNDPSEIETLETMLISATQNDPMGEIVFVAIWGHGTGKSVRGKNTGYGEKEELYKPKGEITEDDISNLKESIKSGKIKFGENAVILITACNAGSHTFAQTIADITDATVIAGKSETPYDEGQVSTKNVGDQDFQFQMAFYQYGSFYAFKKGIAPVEIGNVVSTRELIRQGESVTLKSFPIKKQDLLQVNLPKPDLNNVQLQPITPLFASTPKPNIFEKTASKIKELFKK